jgi:uncharacterized protein with HEPN domain
MPPDRNDRGRLQDIITWAEEAAAHHAYRDLESLLADRQAYLAALYCIQVVGEAAWALTDPVKQRSHVIPWAMVAGMRHRLVHDYGRTDPAIVHRVLSESLPVLVREARRLLHELEAEQA